MKCLLSILVMMPCVVSAAEFSVTQRNGQNCFQRPDGRVVMLLGMSHAGRSARRGAGNDDQGSSIAGSMPWATPRDLWTSSSSSTTRTSCRFSQGGKKEVMEKDTKSSYEDVFDPAVKDKLRKQIAGICKQTVGNPNCVGYWWTDIPTWGGAKAAAKNDFVDYSGNLPKTAPGRIR